MLLFVEILLLWHKRIYQELVGSLYLKLRNYAVRRRSLKHVIGA